MWTVKIGTLTQDKMIYTITDTPLTVRVENLTQLVTIMRQKTSFFANQTNSEYMKGYAERAKLVTGAIIDPSSEAAFVKSCIQAGFIVKGTIKQ